MSIIGLCRCYSELMRPRSSSNISRSLETQTTQNVKIRQNILNTVIQ